MARSLLYRRQILQENIRWKALDEIYKIYMFLHRLDLNISETFRQTFSHVSAKNLQNLPIFENFSLNFGQSLMKFCQNFANIFENMGGCTRRAGKIAAPAAQRLSRLIRGWCMADRGEGEETVSEKKEVDLL